MKIPRMDPKVRANLEAALPKAGVTLKPMFGNIAAFVNGNMFAGVLGEAIFARLSDADRAEAERGGGRPFEPMPGRPMKDYTELPDAWALDPSSLKQWLARAHRHASTLPPKAKQVRNAKAKSPRK
jgi:TfoX/Sxy family transcriptional regulator of competence genes